MMDRDERFRVFLQVFLQVSLHNYGTPIRQSPHQRSPSIDTTAEERVISQKISSSHLGSHLLPFNEQGKMCLYAKTKNISI